MSKFKTVFIEQEARNWILDILGQDIYNGMEQLGYACRIGKYEDYQGEDISFHMWWGNCVPHKEAKVNAVFITHTDDKYKEDRLVRMKDDYDLYFCMSPEDARYLVELGYDESKVFGVCLPVRNTYVRPLEIGIFSRCYPDKRKNEEWLYDYCKNQPLSRNVDFVFIGDGWGEFVSRLTELKCSFQWHNVSRDMPYEYQYQQLKLANLDYYIYMGMDGGAMGSYDAYAMGARLCITDDGFHKEIPDIDYSFTTYDEFASRLDEIVAKHARKLQFYKDNSVSNYVSKVAYIIENGRQNDENGKATVPDYSVKEKRRSNFFDRGVLYGIRLYLSEKKAAFNKRKK